MLPQLIGAFTSAAVQQGQVNRMNRYNDPRSQLQRLNAAGLPFAAFSQGQAGNQSTLPDMSGIGESIASYATSRLQQEQLKLLKEQTRKASAEADITETNRDVLRDEAEFSLFGGIVEDGILRSNAYLSKRLDFQMKQNAAFMQKYEKDIREIDALFKSDQYESGRMKKVAEQELDALINKNDLMKQVWNTNDKQNAARNEIIGRMQKNGLNLAEAMFLVIMQSLGATAKLGGSSIGF